ncbi:hypothetical protein [Kitasatospora sp. HPMI-4]|uniref:hypothetical protein n=1 Tax=Kitasatospora sp. HPMI-4 TaxID=3448443 RepID=UPI003F1A79FA
MPATTERSGRTAVDEAALAELARDPRKRDWYRYDTYLREGLRAFATRFGFATVRDLTFLVLKPDAVAGRRCELVLDTLAADGWHPVAATTFRFDPLLTRELWRYQFNAASEQRIAVVDHLLGSGRSLLVLLEDRGRPAWLPASARLTSAKGVADPSGSRSGDLRTRIGRVNGLFNFIHTADDPADVVRELQLFSYRTGWDWCAPVLSSHQVPDQERSAAAQRAIRALLDELEHETPAHDLDLAASLDRLERLDGPWGSCARDLAAPEHIEDWLAVLRDTPLPAGSSRWDVLAVLTGWIECNEPGVAALLPTGKADDWRPQEDA